MLHPYSPQLLLPLKTQRMASCGEMMAPFVGKKAKAASVLVFFTVQEQSKGLNELVVLARQALW